MNKGCGKEFDKNTRKIKLPDGLNLWIREDVGKIIDMVRKFGENIQNEAKQQERDKLKTITRLELISSKGRVYTDWNIKGLEFSFQDNGRTLKIFFAGKELKSQIKQAKGEVE